VLLLASSSWWQSTPTWVAHLSVVSGCYEGRGGVYVEGYVQFITEVTELAGASRKGDSSSWKGKNRSFERQLYQSTSY